MSIINFSFTKIEAEKTGFPKSNVKINSNIKLKKVEDSEISFGGSDNAGIKIDFEFFAEYDPKIGHIRLEGNILYMGKKDKIENIKKTFKSKNVLPEEDMQIVLNAILSKSNIEALLITRELNLPPTMPMPKVNVQKKEEPKKKWLNAIKFSYLSLFFLIYLLF